MLQDEVLVGELRSVVDRIGTSSVAANEVSTLDHEVGDLVVIELAFGSLADPTGRPRKQALTTRWNLQPL